MKKQSKHNFINVEQWYLDTVIRYSEEIPPEYPELPIKTVLSQIKFKLERKIKGRARFEADHYAERPVDNAICAALLENLRQRKECGERTVAVLSPHPKESTLSASDGYMRRVAQIDQLLLKSEYRVYLYDSDYWNVPVPTVSYYGVGDIAVTYNGCFRSHLEYIRELITSCSVCYIQSIMRILPRIGSSEDPADYLLSSSETKYILDMHGTVPLELELDGKDSKQAVKTEKKCVQAASAVVTVNKISEEYLSSILQGEKAKTYSIPMISASDNICIKEKEVVRVIYAGGTQKWQLMDEMCDAVKHCPREGVVFEFLLSSGREKDKLSGIPNVEVDSVPVSEVAGHLAKSHYGFLLRNDSEINKYGTPTKLIEYIQYQVVPVLKSVEIGDFVDEGMQYIRLGDFVQGLLPSEEERALMAINNMKVLSSMAKEADLELNRLRKDFFE